jgi:hypothetical protein
VFVIVDNGSAHRGKKSIKRLQGSYKNLILVHTPVHASWLIGELPSHSTKRVPKGVPNAAFLTCANCTETP